MNLFLHSYCFNEDDYALMSFGSWINVVAGKMIAINRSAKHVIISKGKKVLYDHLILCTGQQYQVSPNIKSALLYLVKWEKFPLNSD